MTRNEYAVVHHTQTTLVAPAFRNNLWARFQAVMYADALCTIVAR